MTIVGCRLTVDLQDLDLFTANLKRREPLLEIVDRPNKECEHEDLPRTPLEYGPELALEIVVFRVCPSDGAPRSRDFAQATGLLLVKRNLAHHRLVAISGLGLSKGG